MNKAPKHDRFEAVMLMLRAKIRLGEKLLDDAMKDVNEALRLHPRLGEAMMVRATIRVDRSEFQQALEDVEERMKVEPFDPIALLTRGNLRSYLGNHEGGLADFNEYLSKHPPQASILRARGLSHLQLGHHAEAVADVKAAVALEPANGEIYLELGRILQDLGDYAAAVANYQKSLDLGPDQSGIHNQFAWLLAACPRDEFRDGPRAVKLAQRACELTRWQDANFVDTLACAHAECGQWEEALRLARKALESATAEEVIQSCRKHIELFQNSQPARFEKEELPQQ